MILIFWYFCNMFNRTDSFVKQFLDLFHNLTSISFVWDLYILVYEMIFYIWFSFHVWCFALTFPLIFLVFVAFSSRNFTVRATFSIPFIVLGARTRMTAIMSAISRHIHDSYYLNIFLSQMYRKISKKRYIKISYTDVLIKGWFFYSVILYLSVQSWAYASYRDRLDFTDVALALNLTIDLKECLYNLHPIELRVQ